MQTAEVAFETEKSLPELSSERKATYLNKDPNETYAVFCGDDRQLTPESVAALKEKGVKTPENAIRYYGGAVGIARVTALTIATQYGPEAIATYGGNFVDFTAAVRDRVEAANKVVLGVHSAEGNEGNADHIDENAEAGLGCAYAAGVNVVTEISATNEDVAALAPTEQSRQFKDMVPITSLTAAENAVREQFFGTDQTNRGFDRDDFKTLGAPVAIVQGSHAHSDETVVAINYETDQVTDPAAADKAGLKFYDNDVTQVAEMIMKAFPELKLQPAILLSVMDQDIRATRTALASHDGAADPSRIQLERNGDPKAALAHLESLAIA